VGTQRAQRPFVVFSQSRLRAPKAESLSDADISLLCDVGDSFPVTLSAERLIARGFVERASADRYATM